MSENFKTDNVSEIIRLAADEISYKHHVNLVVADRIRKSRKDYIWVVPVKYPDKTVFAWEIEFADGKTKSFGYSEDEHLKSYEEALDNAIVTYTNQPT